MHSTVLTVPLHLFITSTTHLIFNGSALKLYRQVFFLQINPFCLLWYLLHCFVQSGSSWTWPFSYPLSDSAKLKLIYDTPTLSHGCVALVPRPSLCTAPSWPHHRQQCSFSPPHLSSTTCLVGKTSEACPPCLAPAHHLLEVILLSFLLSNNFLSRHNLAMHIPHWLIGGVPEHHYLLCSYLSLVEGVRFRGSWTKPHLRKVAAPWRPELFGFGFWPIYSWWCDFTQPQQLLHPWVVRWCNTAAESCRRMVFHLLVWETEHTLSIVILMIV